MWCEKGHRKQNNERYIALGDEKVAEERGGFCPVVGDTTNSMKQILWHIREPISLMLL